MQNCKYAHELRTKSHLVGPAAGQADTPARPAGRPQSMEIIKNVGRDWFGPSVLPSVPDYDSVGGRPTLTNHCNYGHPMAQVCQLWLTDGSLNSSDFAL